MKLIFPSRFSSDSFGFYIPDSGESKPLVTVHKKYWSTSVLSNINLQKKVLIIDSLTRRNKGGDCFGGEVPSQ